MNVRKREVYVIALQKPTLGLKRFVRKRFRTPRVAMSEIIFVNCEMMMLDWKCQIFFLTCETNEFFSFNGFKKTLAT